MKKNYYIKHLLYSLVFYAIIILLLLLKERPEDQGFYPYILIFGFASSVSFPFAVAIIEHINPKMIKPTHWGWWVGLVALIFAIPLSLLYFITKFKRR